MPGIRKIVKHYFEKEPSLSANPDESVAHGAAILAANLVNPGPSNMLVLMEVTPLSLGIMTNRRDMSNIIERGTRIPASNMKMCSTMRDYQENVSICVYEGERALVKDNHFLGKFELHGIMPALRHEPEIVVTFDIDDDGILSVHAEEKNGSVIGGKRVTITNETNRLSQPEIKDMIEQMERFRLEDKVERLKSKACNELEDRLYHLKHKARTSEFKSMYSEESSATMLECIKDIKEWLKDDRTDTTQEEYEWKKDDLDDLYASIRENRVESVIWS
eukprot:746_1